MPQFIDRRQNPRDKSLGNRQRFMGRARARIKAVVDQSIRERNITDAASSEVITIPTDGIEEPQFRHAREGGRRHRVLPGNKEFQRGDEIERPRGGAGGRGLEGAEEGGGEDEFRFTLSREEFLDIFFEDLELPDLIKKDFKEIKNFTLRRAGHTRSGAATNLNILRTMRNSIGRRIALQRPKLAEVDGLDAEISALVAKAPRNDADQRRLAGLQEIRDGIERRRRAIAYIDPHDIRYNAFQPVPQPNTKAVMFCLMDVSGSMGEREKDLAKRFFILLHLFLKRRYGQVDLVFIRHTHEATEVAEEAFFYSRETGGTIVSRALDKMIEVVKDRYPPAQWNIYAAQASDGENFSHDDARCVSLLQEKIMPVAQYYAYVEIVRESELMFLADATAGPPLWQAYRGVGADWPNFAMKRIARQGDIFPVFRELFARNKQAQS